MTGRHFWLSPVPGGGPAAVPASPAGDGFLGPMAEEPPFPWTPDQESEDDSGCTLADTPGVCSFGPQEIKVASIEEYPPTQLYAAPATVGGPRLLPPTMLMRLPPPPM